MAAIPSTHFQELAQAKYGISPDKTPGSGEVSAFTLAFDRLSGRFQKAHIAHLAQLVRATGTVHLADTYYWAAQPGATWPDDYRPMLSSVVVEESNRHFSPLRPPVTWDHETTEGVFLVLAEALIPKPQ